MADEPTQSMAVKGLGQTDSDLGITSLFQSPATGIDDPAAATSEHIGRYRLLEMIGEGGMGTVYKAEQHRPIQRIVAVKAIRPGFDSREVVARFNAERQALARMDHPGIAKVLDAGADTITGRPYFVMEYVPGQPLTRFCDEQRLTIRQRLDLFRQVCDAIAHAHTKSILHRDIKASNVLGYLQDGKPAVKVIDFGIAKALAGGDPLAGVTLCTSAGQIVGTFETMSPEQSSGDADVDTRTDIYALGVLLYELLSGAKPFVSDVAQRAPAEILRIIREVDPDRPSTRLSKLGAAASQVAEARRARLEDLERQLRSELEWIPLKAMRKDRERRYASAAQLGEDVGNYLAGRPLIAGPETARYRAWKFIGRHRAGLAAAAALVLVLVAAGVSTAWQMIRATQAEVRLVSERVEHEHRERMLAESREKQVRRTLAQSLMANGQKDLANGNAGLAKQQYERAAAELVQTGHEPFETDLLLALTWAHHPPPVQDLPPHLGTEDRLAISADGRRAVTASRGELHVWDLLTGTRVRTVGGSKGAAWKLLGSDPSGRFVLSAGTRSGERNEIVHLWDIDDKDDRLVQSFAGHVGEVMSAAVSENGGTVVTGGADESIRVWNATTGRERFASAHMKGPIVAVAISPGGFRVVACAKGVATATVIDTRSGAELPPLPTGFPHWNAAVAFAPGGRYVAVQPRRKAPRVFELEGSKAVRDYTGGIIGEESGLAMGMQRGRQAILLGGHHTHPKVMVWDLTTGVPLLCLDEVASTGPGTWGPIAICRNGRFAAMTGFPHAIRQWSLTPPPAAGELLNLHDRTIKAIAISPDGRLGVAATEGPDGALIVWDLVTQRAVRKLPAGPLGGFSGIAFCGGGGVGGGYRIAFAASDGSVGLWDLASPAGTATAPTVFGRHDGPASCLSATAEGDRLITGGRDGTVRAWEVATRRSLWSASFAKGEKAIALHTVGFLQSGQRVVTATEDGVVRLLDASTGQLLQTASPVPNVRSIASATATVAADRLWIDVKGTVHAWHPQRGWSWLAEADKLNTTGLAVKPAASGSDGIVVTSTTEMTRAWDMATQREVFAVKAGEGSRLALSTDGRFLVFSGGSSVTTLDIHGPRHRRSLRPVADAARLTLAQLPNDPQALLACGRWWAFHGIDDWAAELMERARGAGASVPSLELGRVYWRLGRGLDASRAFAAAAAAGEAPASYLNLCAAAAERPVDLPSSRPSARTTTRPAQRLAGPPAMQVEER